MLDLKSLSMIQTLPRRTLPTTIPSNQPTMPNCGFFTDNINAEWTDYCYEPDFAAISPNWPFAGDAEVIPGPLIDFNSRPDTSLALSIDTSPPDLPDLPVSSSPIPPPSGKSSRHGRGTRKEIDDDVEISPRRKLKRHPSRDAVSI